MWSSVKFLRSLVVDVLCNGKANRLLELESNLEKHRKLLLHPVDLPVKSASDREVVKKASKEAIALKDIQQRVILTLDLIDEALLLSDILNLNEILVVELLLTAESQLPSYPKLTRGLVAILLFYDIHATVTEILLILAQSRDGRTWSPNICAEAGHLALRYCNNLWSEGLLKSIMAALQKFDIVREFNRLENSQALGDSKHRHDVYMSLKCIDSNLSECIMLWACQSAFTLDEFKQVLDHLLRPTADKNSTTTDASVTSSGMKMVLTHSQVHLLMSLLYSLQPFSLMTPFPEQLSDLTEFDLTHPLFANRGFASSISRLLDEKKSYFERQSDELTDQIAILACLRLAWALCLRRSSHLRAELRRRRTDGGNSSDPDEAGAFPDVDEDFNAGGDDEDEAQAGMAIESGALEFTRKQLLPVTGFEREPLWVYRIHSLVTDLIVYMPARVKEIRMRDEDLLRCTGFDPSTTGHGFANFLLLIAQLYNHPGSQLHARLALEYWWPMGEVASGPINIPGSSEFLSSGLPSRSPSKLNASLYVARSRTSEMDNVRQASLFRFVRSAGDMVSTPCLFLPYIRMIHGLTCSRSAAELCFSLLKSNLNSQGRGASIITWDHFFASFRQYLTHMKQPTVQPELSTNRPSNQLYHHLYFSDSANSRLSADPLSKWATHNRLAMRKTSGGHGSESMTTLPNPSQPITIQPEEQAGLQAVLRLVFRICCMDPVSRSSFATNQQWQVIQICVGFLTCPVSLELKADLVQVLASLSRSQPIAGVVWREFTNSELLPFIYQKPRNQNQVTCGLHTDMDEVEPRAEEYPITRAFLTLMTTLIPRVGSPTASLEPRDNPYFGSTDDLVQGNALVGVVSFIVNTIFLRHTMRAYRDPNERWDIAASCLVLFDALVGDFLRNLNNAISVITSAASGQRTTHTSDSLFALNDSGSQTKHTAHSPDWASNLISALDQLDKEQQTAAHHGRVRSSSTLVAALAQLRLPYGWPLSDPGYLLVTQLFSDSSLFRMVTGLLEVGLHRLLEFPIPNGPPVGMTRATMAGLRLVCQLLTNEDVLVTFIRRTATTFQPGLVASVSAAAVSVVPLPTPPSFGMTVLPICLSRLLMSVNSGTGTADLIPMLLKYCSLADYLPEHSAFAVNILGLLVGSIKPHSDLLALLVADQDTRRYLLNTFASLLKWPICQEMNVLDASGPNPCSDNEGFFTFTDEWIYGEADAETGFTHLVTLGVASTEINHPATLAAANNAAFPIQTPYWYFPDQDWELWSAWPIKYRPLDSIPIKSQSFQSSYYGVAFGSWLFQSITNQNSVPLPMRLLHILLATLDQPAPNLSHWLLGFRIDSAKAVSHTTLQDAGIGDQPRTCLHGILDIIDTASRIGQQTSLAVPFDYITTIHWTMSIIWQILYRLAASPLTSEPLLRFLRSNHDLLAKHMQFILGQDLIPSLNQLSLSDPGLTSVDGGVLKRRHAILESLILNQRNWLLRIVVIELRTAVFGNQWSYVSKLLRLFLGDILVDNAAPIQEDRKTASILASFLKSLNVSEALADPGLLKLQALDVGLVEELLLQSELGCCLLASDLPAVRNVSSMINPQIFLTNLKLKFLTTQTDSSSFSAEELTGLFQWASDETTLPMVQKELISTLPGYKDVATLVQWINARNMHRLRLYAGKQAAVEAWRQFVEISLGLLIRESQSVFSTSGLLTVATSSSGLAPMFADNPGLGFGRGHDSGLQSNTLRPLPVICLDVLLLLLFELCASNSTPQTMKLLASGTCLNLSSFLHLGSKLNSNDSTPGRSNQCLMEYKQWTPLILTVTQLLTKAIMNTKSSAQRIRANYYGSLCYIVRFCQNLESHLSVFKDQTTSDILTLSSNCLSIICSNFPTTATTVGRSEDPMDSMEHVQLHAMLADDLIHGHTITQMSAMSLLDLIISFDRCFTGLISCLDRQGILQHLVDTIPEDLKTLQTYLTICSQPLSDDMQPNWNGEPNQPAHLLSAATSAFHLYQSKMCFLCRLANSAVGAKVLVNLDILNHLAACDIFSQSNLANCYSDGLDSLYMCEDLIDRHHRQNPEDPTLINLNWFRQTLDLKLPHLPNSSDDLLFYHLINSMNHVQFPDGHDRSISWSGILLPVLRLAKTMLISLGPAHVSCSQQLFNLLYAHSAALMCNEVELGTSLVTFLSRNDWTYLNNNNNNNNNTCLVGSDWLIQWIASESSLINLFAQSMRAFQATSGTQYMDEYSTLQREVVHSKIIRHVLDSLSSLYGCGSDLTRPHSSRCQSSRLAFEQLLIRTQQIQLVRNLLNVLTFYMSGSRFRKVVPSETSDLSAVKSLFSFFVGSNTNQIDGPITCLSLFTHILAWSLKQLSLIEQLVSVLVDTKFFSKRQRDPVVATSEVEKHSDHRFNTVINQLLHSTTLNDNITLEELKQASSAIYDCPASFLTCSTESSRGLPIQKQSMELLLLQRFAQVGLSLIRIQLRSLIVIVEQSLYIVWRHVSDHTSNALEELSKSSANLLDKSAPLYRVRDLSARWNSPDSKTFSPSRQAAPMSNKNKSRIKEEMSSLSKQLPALLNEHVFESIAQLAKATYLESNQRLFLQAMMHRTQRLVSKMNAIDSNHS